MLKPYAEFKGREGIIYARWLTTRWEVAGLMSMLTDREFKARYVTTLDYAGQRMYHARK